MEKKKLLLVDDVELFLHLQISFLGRSNFDIHTASSGTEAIAMAREIQPDLIILDYVMDDMLGSEVCRRLREEKEIGEPRIIIMSSRYGEEALASSVSAGCDAFLFKPMRRDSFLNAVEEQLGTRIRRSERADTCLECAIQVRSNNEPCRILSLSASGCFVEYARPVSPGDKVDLQFRLPGYDRMIAARGQVVWTGNVGEDKTPGVGIEFVVIDSAEQELVRRYVAAREGQWK